MLNVYKWDEIAILDPHSDMVFSVINKSFGLYPTQKVLDLYNSLSIDKVCYPDKGALVKYNMKYNLPFVHAEKERNPLTGEILSHKLIGNVQDKSILIVDDLCDGGATFISLKTLLYNNGASDVHLFVTHGLFTKGIDHLKSSGIKRIFSKKGEH
jgi:ribose-phosphate pyrophosphokinase